MNATFICEVRIMIQHRFVLGILSVALLLPPLACSAAPGSIRVRKIDNTERTFIRWHGTVAIENKNRPGSCLEFSTAATKLNSVQAGARAGYQGFEVGAEGSNIQNLGSIYEVQSIMQFAHTALFRLCEAQRNGDFDSEHFSEIFEETLRSVRTLLISSDLSRAVQEMSSLIVRLSLEREVLMVAEEGQEATIRNIKSSICGQFDKDGAGLCQVKLSDWVGRVRAMPLDELEELPPYDKQVGRLFEQLEPPLKKNPRVADLKFDFVELMSLVKAYAKRERTKERLKLNAALVDAAHQGLRAVASLVPEVEVPPAEELSAGAEEALNQRRIEALQGSVCDQFEEKLRDPCNVELTKWARGVLAEGKEKLKSPPDYVQRVRELFQASKLLAAAQDSVKLNLDSVVLMTLVEAHAEQARLRHKRAVNEALENELTHQQKKM